MFCVAVWKFLSLYEAVAWDIFLRLFAVFGWITWNVIAFLILMTSLNLLINVFCVTVWKFLSLYEAVAWNIFLRLFTVFGWAAWNLIPFLILMTSLNLLINMFCVAVWLRKPGLRICRVIFLILTIFKRRVALVFYSIQIRKSSLAYRQDWSIIELLRLKLLPSRPTKGRAWPKS